MKIPQDYRILVVDDEPEFLIILEKYFKFLGYNFYSAANGPEALKILQKEEIDIVICDVIMPRMSGIELFKKVSHSKKCPYFFFCSGSEFPFKSPYPEKIVGFISKPFDLPDLLANMARHLEQMVEA